MKPCRKDNISSRPYRFKKWTNKSYAVFNSIGREISIGVLSSAISSRIGAKDSCHNSYIFLCSIKNSSEEVPEEEPDGQIAALKALPETAIKTSDDSQGEPCSDHQIEKYTSLFSPGYSFAIFIALKTADTSFISFYRLINHTLKFITL